MLGAPVYARHRPERRLLYPIIEEYVPVFRAHLAQKGVALPEFVEQGFDTAFFATSRFTCVRTTSSGLRCGE